MNKNKANHELLISIRSKTIVKLILTIAVAFVLLRFIRSVSSYLALIALGAFIALALNPLVVWMHKNIGGSRGVAILTTIIVIFVVAGGSLAAITPTLANQTVSFVNDFPSRVNELKNGDSVASRLARQFNIDDEASSFSSDFSSRTQNLASFALNIAGRFSSAIVSIIAVIVLSIMMLSEGPKWAAKFWQLQPKRISNRYKPLAEQMYGVVTGYVNGQIIVSLIGALISLLLFIVLGLPNAAVLAAIMFLAGLIPLIGLPIGAGFVILIALLASLDKALILLVFYLIYWQIQNSTIQPYVLAKSNDMTPLTVFIAALIGIEVAGLLGAFIAIPTVGCIRILLLDAISRKRLGSS